MKFKVITYNINFVKFNLLSFYDSHKFKFTLAYH